MTTNNHPANGPVSLARLHQIREILSKAAAQSDGGNLGYAIADAVKVIDGAIAAFGADPAPLQLPVQHWEELCRQNPDMSIGDAIIRAAWWHHCVAVLQAEPVRNSDEFPLDYIQGHKDGLEWAAQLAEANHPQTGDWLYDDPTELARAIRKGPDMPTVQDGNSPVAPDCNGSIVGKALTITLPDTSSKAFWSGTGKSEVFHPETYKCWAKESIERACVISGIGVVVK